MVELTAVDPCFICQRESDMSVDIEGTVRGLCSDCWETADFEKPLDYSEDEWDENREGQPEFNGAFGG